MFINLGLIYSCHSNLCNISGPVDLYTRFKKKSCTIIFLSVGDSGIIHIGQNERLLSDLIVIGSVKLNSNHSDLRLKE
jgi:hypothetical protein